MRNPPVRRYDLTMGATFEPRRALVKGIRWQGVFSLAKRRRRKRRAIGSHRGRRISATIVRCSLVCAAYKWIPEIPLLAYAMAKEDARRRLMVI